MIDIEKELSRMSSEFGIPEKEVISNWRNFVRFAWSKSVFKLEFMKQHSQKVKNDNTRSMKRYPYVTKYECNICKGLFSVTDIELDHLFGENSMKSLGDAEPFFQAIAFPKYDELQILCKDKKKKVKGKNQIVRFGCHSLKSYSERYNVSFKQAKAEKTALELIKIKQDKQWLLERSITPESTQVKRREQIVKCLLENND